MILVDRIFKVVVPISGGKDSQSCLKLALTQYRSEEILGLFCDTGFEHPLTYAHVKSLSTRYGVVIHTIRGVGDVPHWVIEKGRFPSFQARFCTDRLKIQPSKKFYLALALAQGQGFEVWYGMRSAESSARAKRYSFVIEDEVYPPHEFMRKYPKYLFKAGITFRLPILSWSTQEVLAFLDGGENPLYSQGFDRVGCFPCLAGGDSWKRAAFSHDAFGESQWKKVEFLQREIGKSVFNKDNRGPGCAVCSI